MNAMSKRGIPRCTLCRAPMAARDGTHERVFYRHGLVIGCLAHVRCIHGAGAPEDWRMETVGCRPIHPEEAPVYLEHAYGPATARQIMERIEHGRAQKRAQLARDQAPAPTNGR